MFPSTPSSSFHPLRMMACGLFVFTLLLLPLAVISQPIQTNAQGSVPQNHDRISVDPGLAIPASRQSSATAISTSIRYFYTFGAGSPPDADFVIWGGTRSTICGMGCSYDQNIVSSGNPSGALTLYLNGTNGRGGAGPRQNGAALLTALNFDYSADFYVYNGQLNARYGLVFDAGSGVFPDSGEPPMDPSRNYYVLEMRMDTVTRTNIAKWQFVRMVNGTREAVTTATDLPSPLTQGQWHNLKVRQQATTLSFYFNGQFVASAQYDSTWGDQRRHFGLYLDVRDDNGVSGPFEYFADNIAVADLTPPGSIAITGPTTGALNATSTFTATITPISTTTPITYIWEAAEQVPIIHSSTWLTDSASFVWSTPGTKAIIVTASNAVGTMTATHSLEIPVGPTSVTLAGPVAGALNVTYLFTASTLPISATTPITYLWQATDQSPVAHSGIWLTDSAAFTWTIPGTKIMTVTAMNVAGEVTATHFIEFPIGLTSVQIDGLSQGTTNTTLMFIAIAIPLTATTPVTYLWQATDQSPVTHSGQWVTDAVSFIWPISGTKNITVTATNIAGTVMATRSIEVRKIWKVFLPAVLKSE